MHISLYVMNRFYDPRYLQIRVTKRVFRRLKACVDQKSKQTNHYPRRSLVLALEIDMSAPNDANQQRHIEADLFQDKGENHVDHLLGAQKVSRSSDQWHINSTINSRRRL